MNKIVYIITKYSGDDYEGDTTIEAVFASRQKAQRFLEYKIKMNKDSYIQYYIVARKLRATFGEEN